MIYVFYHIRTDIPLLLMLSLQRFYLFHIIFLMNVLFLSVLFHSVLLSAIHNLAIAVSLNYLFLN